MSRLASMVHRLGVRGRQAGSRQRSLGIGTFVPAILATLCACSALIPPVSSAPAPRPNEQSALVVFLLDGRARSPFTVRDEQGQMLGRVSGRSWFAVERPAGPQWFFAGSPVCEGETGSTSVGALSADLEAGHVYLVRVSGYLGNSRSLRDRLRDLRQGGCCSDQFTGPDQYIDLIGVRPGGTEWNRALDVLRVGVRYQAAPRGLDEVNVDHIPARGRARFGHCIDEERSRLRAEDGVPYWPLEEVEPTIDHISADESTTTVR